MGRVSCFRLLAASGRGGGFTQPFLQILVVFVYQCTNSTDTFVRIHEGNGSSQDWTFCSLIGLAFPVQSWATKGGPPVRYRSQISEDWCGLPVLYRRSSPSLDNTIKRVLASLRSNNNSLNVYLYYVLRFKHIYVLHFHLDLHLSSLDNN